MQEMVNIIYERLGDNPGFKTLALPQDLNERNLVMNAIRKLYSDRYYIFEETYVGVLEDGITRETRYKVRIKPM